MRITHAVYVPATPDEVWRFVTDVPRVAPCLPGAELVDTLDERTYEGTVRVRVGPLQVHYRGTLSVEDRDESARTMVMAGYGQDRRGAGAARARITVAVHPDVDQGTRLLVGADIALTGRLAGLGRGVNEVSHALLEDFAHRMAQQLATPAATPVAAAVASGPAPAEPAARVVQDGLPAGVPSGGDASSVRLGALVMSVVRARVGRLLVRLGERIHG